ncbi:MAG: epoxyqueuosine reductase QueH [Clostridia bacterium]|nr:epoxyqueuosine reductase QueH [Clostridia bacterium]
MNEIKVNYQLILDETIRGIVESGKRPTLMLHSCCGPCSSYVLEYLTDYFDITVLYYNPSIYPQEEYEHRRDVQVELIEAMKAEGKCIDYILDEYNHDEFLCAVEGHEADPEGGERCHLCFEQRLRRTATVAKEKKSDYFCTTLTVSPYKNAKVLNELGLAIEEEMGVPFLASDFKKRNGYKRSIELSKKYCLYRQHYCGCEFSKEV